jgi:hypothetical protein
MTDNAAGGKRKGLHPVAWVGIGCGVLVLLVVVVVVVMGIMGVRFFEQKVAAAERLDAEARERWVAESGLGGGGLERLADWFDLPEGLSGVRSVVHQEENGTMSGQVAAESGMVPLLLGEAFAKNLAAAGFEQKSKIETEEMVTYHFEHRSRNRSVSITITAGTGQNRVTIIYEGE